jgi:hypothetical protein
MPNLKLLYLAQFREQMVEPVRADSKPAELAKEFSCHPPAFWAGCAWPMKLIAWYRVSPVHSVQRNVKNSWRCAASWGNSKWSVTYWQRQAQVCQQRRQDVYPVYALIAANQAELPVRTMCKTLKVSTSGFYGWLDRPLCERRQANAVLTVQIREAFVASDATHLRHATHPR